MATPPLAGYAHSAPPTAALRVSTLVPFISTAIMCTAIIMMLILGTRKSNYYATKTKVSVSMIVHIDYTYMVCKFGKPESDPEIEGELS